MTIEFNTTYYHNTWKKQPKGYGALGFYFGHNENVVCPPGSMSYADAKRWARMRARELEVSIVFVLS